MKQSQPSKLPLLACLLGMGALASAKAGQVTYDFKTDPTTGTNPIKITQNGFADGSGTSVYWKAEGGNPDGFLGITWPLGGSTTIAVFPDIDPGKVVTAFTFECDLRIGSPQQNERPADGFSINFARSTDPAVENPDAGSFATSGAVETGTQTGIAICFDTWQGNALPDGGDIEGIIVRVDNKTILRQEMPTRNGACDDTTSLQTGPRPVAYWTAAVDAGTLPDAAFAKESWTNLCWQHLIVELDTAAKLSVTYKGRKLLDKYQTTFFPSAGSIILAGRTGGADEHTHFDNVKLSTTASTDASPPSVPGAITVGATTAGKVALTWGAATDDSGRVGYNVERDGTLVATLLNEAAYIDFNVQGGKTYSYKVQAVDPAGNKSAFGAAATATTPASNPVATEGLTFEAWYNINGTPVSNLTDDERYVNNTPDFRALATALDTRTVFANDGHENYGGRLSGLLIPKDTGNYEFFLRSDDASQLFLSPDDKTANLALVAEETGCCAAFQETGDPRTSAPISLTAGKKYAIQVLWKEGGGGDYAQVAWRKSGDTTAAGSLKPIAKDVLQTTWDATIGQPVLTTFPKGQGVDLGGTATLTSEATIGDKPFKYQWSYGGKDIAGATNPAVTVSNFAIKDIGAYTVTVGNSFGSVSATAALLPKGALFVEAEDFNYGGGKYITDKPIGLTGAYPGDAYRGLGTEADDGIDYHADNGGAQPYREATNVDVDKENQHADGIPRGDFDVKVNTVVGWNDAGEWLNYTRAWPAPNKDYNVIGRLASGGNPIHIQMDEVTAGAKTANQTLKKLGEFNPGRATPGWDNMEYFPLVDDGGNLAVIKDWGGERTFKVTMLPNSAEDMDYFMFIPVGSSPSTGNTFSSVTKTGTNLVIAWAAGSLEQADSVTGPWTAVPNATSPATIPLTGSGKFYRLK